MTTTILQHTGLHRNDVDSIHIQGTDIRDLIHPYTLRSDVVDFVLTKMFPRDHPDTLYVGMDFTQCLTDANTPLEGLHSDAILTPKLHAILQRIFTKRITIFTFNRNGHFVGAMLERPDTQNAYTKISYLASLKWDGNRVLTSITRLLLWMAHIHATTRHHSGPTSG